jgi:hypothetical protein
LNLAFSFFFEKKETKNSRKIPNAFGTGTTAPHAFSGLRSAKAGRFAVVWSPDQRHLAALNCLWSVSAFLKHYSIHVGLLGVAERLSASVF